MLLLLLLLLSLLLLIIIVVTVFISYADTARKSVSHVIALQSLGTRSVSLTLFWTVDERPPHSALRWHRGELAAGTWIVTFFSGKWQTISAASSVPTAPPPRTSTTKWEGHNVRWKRKGGEAKALRSQEARDLGTFCFAHGRGIWKPRIRRFS